MRDTNSPQLPPLPPRDGDLQAVEDLDVGFVDLSGTTLGDRYRLKGRLGAGAVGSVYLADHELMRTEVAVKVLHPDTSRHPEIVQRFQREAQALARIQHPHVCGAKDFGQTADGAFYLVMEHLEGETLADLLDREGPLASDRAVFIAEQVCAGLERCHELGIVHRDLKPENIMLVERDGYRDFVKIFDFGIAKVTHPDGEGSKLTASGLIYGTAEYMSPEQAVGAAVDERTDLYAVGVILFEMLSGRLPFETEDRLELLRMQVEQVPRTLREVAPHAGIPQALSQIVARLLAKKRQDRFQTTSELREALGAVWSGPSTGGGFGAAVSGALEGVAGAFAKLPPKARIAVAGGLALLVVIALIVGSSGGDDGPPEAALAEAEAESGAPSEPQARPDTPEEAVAGTPAPSGEEVAAAGDGQAAAEEPVELAGGDEADEADEADENGELELGVTEPVVPAGPSTPTPPEPVSVEVVAAPESTEDEPDPSSLGPSKFEVPGAPKLPPRVARARAQLEADRAPFEAREDVKQARARLEQGGAEAAVVAFRNITKKEPDNAHAHYWHARALSAASRPDKALKAFARVLRLHEEYRWDGPLSDVLFGHIAVPNDPHAYAAEDLLVEHVAEVARDRLQRLALQSTQALVRERAVRILEKSGQLDELPGWVREVLRLQAATTCEGRKPHVEALARIGDKRALPMLVRLAESRTGCGPAGTDDCHACMRAALDDAVAAMRP